jgi:hypothetical protein
VPKRKGVDDDLPFFEMESGGVPPIEVDEHGRCGFVLSGGEQLEPYGGLEVVQVQIQLDQIAVQVDDWDAHDAESRDLLRRLLHDLGISAPLELLLEALDVGPTSNLPPAIRSLGGRLTQSTNPVEHIISPRTCPAPRLGICAAGDLVVQEIRGY